MLDKDEFVKKLDLIEQNCLHFWNQQQNLLQKQLTVIKPQKIRRPVLFIGMKSMANCFVLFYQSYSIFVNVRCIFRKEAFL